MATVSQWTPFGVALDITATGGTVTRTSATQYKVTINASWKAHWSGASTKYGMTASSGGGSVNLKTFNNTAASNGSGSFTGTYSISGNGAATKTITVTFRNFNNDNGDSATKNVTFNVSVPAWTSYTVKYNTNGGSGSFANQTKWKDQTLTLHSTKPTRTGHSFLGWSTSSTAASATYSAGGSYTANSAATLYAVWKADTYTITFNANGGSGAPGKQTKTYGKTLTLSTTKPTRTNYEFLGWSTSSTATSATYSAGGSYTANSAATLYAVWKLSYTKPAIADLTIDRCVYDETSGYVLNEEGTYALVQFNLTTSRPISSINVEWVSEYGDSYSKTFDDINGMTVTAEPINIPIGAVSTENISLNVDTQYTVYVTVTDENGYFTLHKNIPGNKYIIDILPNNRGIAFGKTAVLDDTAEFGYNAIFNGSVYGTVRGLAELPIIPVNSDIDTYLTYGCWAVESNADAGTMSNLPHNRAGILEVSSPNGVSLRSSGWNYFKQRYTPYDPVYGEYTRLITRAVNNGNVEYVYGEWIKSNWGITTLYEDTSGNFDTITFSQSIWGLVYIDIFYVDNNSTDSGHIRYYTSGGSRHIDLSLIEASSATVTYIRRTSYTISESGNTLTPDLTTAGFVKISGNAVSHTSGSNYIKITRVIGYA